jgi:hypothetical protein
MSKLRALSVAFLAIASLVAAMPCRAAETLSGVLIEHKIPTEHLSSKSLNENITSYSVFDGDGVAMIAYYVDDGSGKLQPPLHVARYSKSDSRWTEASISREDAKLPKETLDCLGSATAVHHLGDYFLLDTHLSPSSGCVIMLSSKLKVTKVLDGWYLAGVLSHIVIYHEGMVHFAPTQPMTIRMYDPSQEKVSATVRSSYVSVNTLYPPREDPYRAQYVETLRPLVGDQAWCNAHNTNCDPANFGSELTNEGTSGGSLVATNDSTQGLAFVVEYSPVGIVPVETIKKTPALKQDVVYIFQLSPQGFGYREFPLDEMQDRFGVATIQELVNPPAFNKVFGSETR